MSGAAAGRRPNVLTVRPGAPFLRSLVAACMDGSLGVRFPADGRDYSAATIYVPTRRAARALAHAFAEALQPRAVLLPRIVPLGDPADLEERAILSAEETSGLAGGGELPPAIGDLDRRFQLAALIERWRKSRDLVALAAAGDGFQIGGGFADSFALAGDLARLMDEFTIEGVDWEQIRGLTDGQFDTWWSLTQTFLEIAWKAWPAAMQEAGLLDPADRLNRMLRGEAQRLAAESPTRRSSPPARPARCRQQPPCSAPSRACRTAPSSCRASTSRWMRAAGSWCPPRRSGARASMATRRPR